MLMRDNCIRSTATAVACIILLLSSGASCKDEMAVIDLQTDIESLVAGYEDVEVGVSIRDPAGDFVLDLNGEREFHAASTMKVAVMIELFRQAEAGYYSLDDSLEIKNEFASIVDGSTFAVEDDTDKEIYSMIGRRMSIRDLTYRLITSSSNLATNILIELVTADSVQATIEGMGTRSMKVLRGVEDIKAFEAGMNNTTTSSDLALLLEAIRAGTAVSADASAGMLRIMADVPVELILPGPEEGGFVAHKTGRITAHHHDAGIVYPGDGEPYVLVILTRGIAEEDRSTSLGRAISEVVHRHLRQ